MGVGGLRAPHDSTPHGGVEGDSLHASQLLHPSLLALLGARPSSQALKTRESHPAYGAAPAPPAGGDSGSKGGARPPHPSALSTDAGPQCPGEARPRWPGEEWTRGAVPRAAGEDRGDEHGNHVCNSHGRKVKSCLDCLHVREDGVSFSSGKSGWESSIG